MQIEIRMRQEDDGEYRAWCPALPGCEVWGLSREEAREKIGPAVRGYLAHLSEALPRELGRLAKVG